MKDLWVKVLLKIYILVKCINYMEFEMLVDFFFYRNRGGLYDMFS